MPCRTKPTLCLPAKLPLSSPPHTHKTDGLWLQLPRRRRRLHDVREESPNTTDNNTQNQRGRTNPTKPTNEKTEIKPPLQKRRQPNQPHQSGRGQRQHAGRRRSQRAQEAGGRRRADAGGRTMRAQSLGCNPFRDCALSQNRGRCFHCIEERLRVLGLAPKQCCSGRLFFALRWRYGKVRDDARSFFSLPIPSEVAFCFFRGANEGLLVGGSVGRCPCCSVHSPWCWLRPRARSPAASLAGCMAGGWEWWWRTRRETGDGNGQCYGRGVCFEDLWTLGQGSTSPGRT